MRSVGRCWARTTSAVRPWYRFHRAAAAHAAWVGIRKVEPSGMSQRMSRFHDAATARGSRTRWITRSFGYEGAIAASSMGSFDESMRVVAPVAWATARYTVRITDPYRATSAAPDQGRWPSS